MNEAFKLMILIWSMIIGQLFVGYYSVTELVYRLWSLLEYHQKSRSFPEKVTLILLVLLLSIILVLFSVEIMLIYFKTLVMKERFPLSIYLYTSVLYNFLFMGYNFQEYFRPSSNTWSLAMGVIMVILQLMLVPVSFESDKLVREEKFYKRNLEFVNRTFTLSMGLTTGNGNSGAGRNQISVDDSLNVEI